MRIAGAKACRGFSVAELIISILVISIILAAFTPLITQKARNSLTVRTNVTKGLEIYTNPGTYAFDVPLGINTLFIQGAGGGGGGAGATSEEKEVSITTSTNWIVPSGVSQVTFTIQGAGGGGGGANGSSTGNTKCTPSKVDEFLAIRGGNNEEDLCWMKKNFDSNWLGWPAVNATNGINSCDNSTNCSWNYTNLYCSSPAGVYSGCNRQVSTYKSAENNCGSYGKGHNEYRLPMEYELNKVVKYLDDWSRNAGANGLMLCTSNTNNDDNEGPNVPYCGDILSLIHI